MTFWEAAAYILALGIVLILIRIFIKPIKSLFLLTLNSVLGGVGLYLFNLVGTYIGMSIGINIVTASITGALGIPGLLMLVMLKLIIKA